MSLSTVSNHHREVADYPNQDKLASPKSLSTFMDRMRTSTLVGSLRKKSRSCKTSNDDRDDIVVPFNNNGMLVSSIPSNSSYKSGRSPGTRTTSTSLSRRPHLPPLECAPKHRGIETSFPLTYNYSSNWRPGEEFYNTEYNSHRKLQSQGHNSECEFKCKVISLDRNSKRIYVLYARGVHTCCMVQGTLGNQNNRGGTLFPANADCGELSQVLHATNPWQGPKIVGNTAMKCGNTSN